jgi:integrase/recombinase XerD
VAHWQATSSSRTVSDVIDSLIAERSARKARGARGGSDRYLRDLRQRLAKFRTDFGERVMADVTKRGVQDWLAKVPATPSARAMDQRLLSVVWQFAVERDWCPDNVVKKIYKEEIPSGKITVLTVEQAAKLLTSASARFAPTLAVWLFCGLRRTEMERVTANSINLESGLVTVHVSKTKGAARRYVKIRPCLREWLESRQIEALTPQQFRDEMDAAIDGAGIRPWPKNVIRHSFCSYALAHERNLNDLTLEMGHTNPHTLFAHYRELVTPEDAAAYWELTPEAAKTLASEPCPR